MNFQKGDKVRHKLTKDDMIVTRIDTNGRVGCRRYIVDKDEYSLVLFESEELEKVGEDMES